MEHLRAVKVEMRWTPTVHGDARTALPVSRAPATMPPEAREAIGKTITTAARGRRAHGATTAETVPGITATPARATIPGLRVTAAHARGPAATQDHRGAVATVAHAAAVHPVVAVVVQVVVAGGGLK